METLGLFTPRDDGFVDIDRCLMPDFQKYLLEVLPLEDKALLIEEYSEICPEYSVNILLESWKHSEDIFENLLVLSRFNNFQAITNVLSGLISFGRISKAEAKSFVLDVSNLIQRDLTEYENFNSIYDVISQQYLVCDFLEQLEECESRVALN